MKSNNTFYFDSSRLFHYYNSRLYDKIMWHYHMIRFELKGISHLKSMALLKAIVYLIKTNLAIVVFVVSYLIPCMYETGQVICVHLNE